MKLHWTLHRNADHWADVTHDYTPQPGRQDSLLMCPSRHAADYIRLRLEQATEDPRPGWVNARVAVEYNSCVLGDGAYYQPITFYGEPTDWNSGLVRYADQFGWPDARGRGDVAAVWTLGVRRVAR